MNTHSNLVWTRLRRNKGAVFGMVVIGLAIITALTAYYIAPDFSPDANRMILEIGGQRPGYTGRFLCVMKDKPVAHVSFIHRLLYGQEDPCLYIPVNGYSRKGDSMNVRLFIDEGVEETASWPLSALRGGADGHSAIIKRTFLLGTDRYGRDILSRLLIGVRVSLAVGTITVLISLSLGVLLGSLAGYFGGRVDNLVMWFVNVIWSIPTLLLVFAISLMLGKGFWQVFVAIGLTMWVNVARLVRGQVMAVREREYVEAATALGFPDIRIIWFHILPNVFGPVLVVAASNFASAIVIEAGLSFLGIGVQAPQPSWGLMIKENYNFIITHNPMLALAPGLAIMLLVLAFNLLGNGLRDVLNVRG